MSYWKNIAEASRRLQSGEAVGVPTETVYGLAALYRDETAIRSVFRIKGRPLFDPLIVHIGRTQDLRELVAGDIPEIALALAKQFWPGPLTLVLPKSENVSTLITAGADTVAVRLPAHPFARRIARRVGPFVAPSANRFKKISPTTAAHVAAAFPSEKIFVLDGGPATLGIESTVIGFNDHQQILLYRPGLVTAESLRAFAEVLSVDHRALKSATSRAALASPGTMSEHYQPDIPLYLIENEADAELIDRLAAFHRKAGVEWVLASEPFACARHLYREMRDLASTDAGFIYIRKFAAIPRFSGAEWEAIWDRLNRAKSPIPPELL